MSAMPLLNRQPETPYILGLLVVLALIVTVSVFRYFPFFLHQVLGVR
jgi:Mg2+ and Co2+ transporter CorA